MLALDTTPGGMGANAYCTLEQAEAYMASLAFGEDWGKADDAKKTAALIQAARWMGTLNWVGTRATQEQALAWPRRGVVDRDGFDVAEDAIPTAVADANAEFAFRLLGKDRAADGKRGVQLGSLRTYDKSRMLTPASVIDLLKGLVIPTGSIPMARG